MSDLTPDELRGLPLGRLLLHAHRRAQAASLAKLQQRGHAQVRPGHLPVITNLDPEGTRISDLANRSGMTRQMMGRLVRELAGLGYLATRPDPADQRAVVVTMTDRGTALGTDAAAVIAELEEEYARLLGDPDLSGLRAALAGIIDASPTA